MKRDVARLSVETLVAARDGDRAAIAAVFDEAEPLIQWWAQRLSNPRTLPEDLRGVGRLAVFDALRTFQPGKGHFLGWLTWWLKGRMRGALRTARRDVTREVELEWQDVDPAPLASEVLSDEATRQELRAAIRRLPRYMREVLEGRLNGDTLQTIGDRLGRSRECIRKHEFHALQLVRETMEAA